MYFKDHAKRTIRPAANAEEVFAAVADNEAEHEYGYVRRQYAVPRRVQPPIGNLAAKDTAARREHELTREEEIQVENHRDPTKE